MIRVGLGYDVHPFADDESRALVLGGVHIEGRGLAGHSDADAVCHAVADALLGPAGLPDLGTLFPASDDTLPRRVVDRAAARRRAAGRRRRLVGRQRRRRDRRRGAAPRAAPRRDGRRTWRPVLGGAHVSVKPKRGEGIGTVGRAEGIACWAVALLEHAERRPGRPLPSTAMVRIRDTPAARHRGADARASRARCRCTCAARPSTTSPHVGHGRTALVFDMIRRYLEWTGLDVTYVSNVTDVEDKIIARAAERRRHRARARAASSRTCTSTQLARLGVRPADHTPHATEYIDGCSR